MATCKTGFEYNDPICENASTGEWYIPSSADGDNPYTDSGSGSSGDEPWWKDPFSQVIKYGPDWVSAFKGNKSPYQGGYIPPRTTTTKATTNQGMSTTTVLLLVAGVGLVVYFITRKR